MTILKGVPPGLSHRGCHGSGERGRGLVAWSIGWGRVQIQPVLERLGTEHGPGLGIGPGALDKHGPTGESLSVEGRPPLTHGRRNRVEFLCERKSIIQEESQVSRAPGLGCRGEDPLRDGVVSLGCWGRPEDGGGVGRAVDLAAMVTDCASAAGVIDEV